MSKGGGSVKTQPVVAEETVTPAVGKAVAADTETAQSQQEDTRARMRGIRSTYTRYASDGAGNGTATKLG